VVTGRIDIDDEIEVVHMDTARRHVGGHQDGDMTVLEVGQRPGALGLGLAAVQRRRPHTDRQQLIRGLLEGKADVSTVRLAERAVDGRGRSFAASMRSYQVAAAARRNASIATVRVATDLSEAERTRLADALSRQYGRQVQLNVIVDPQVVGGVRVDIGDEVIDGTIAARLDDAQRRIAG